LNVPRFLRRLFAEPYDGFQHLGTVTEGVLYRCGQPKPEQLVDLIQRYGLKTVVALRGSRDPDDPDSWEAAERAVCNEHGVEFVTLPCNHKNPPSPTQVKQFLDICRDEARRPVLVHCRIGQQRTMMFCALFWVHVEDVDPDAAEQKMDALGFGTHVRRHRRLLDTFREYARRDDL
jgi:protein tyrosine/serine phosphatase